MNETEMNFINIIIIYLNLDDQIHVKIRQGFQNSSFYLIWCSIAN